MVDYFQPRVALAVLAASLRENNIDVSVLDCKFEKIPHKKAVQIICQLNPDIVGYTATTPEIIQAARLAKDVKKRLP
ncbi:MAG: cobalamin B12-binding domain-containing protein, partial [Pseudomonadales bacterium]|nr:cobalamin B12-binding domain-containing protein [Pseudomonadales bacterium]